MVGRRETCVDLIGVSALVELKNAGFALGQITFKVASNKAVKHKKIYFDD